MIVFLSQSMSCILINPLDTAGTLFSGDTGKLDRFAGDVYAGNGFIVEARAVGLSLFGSSTRGMKYGVPNLDFISVENMCSHLWSVLL